MKKVLVVGGNGQLGQKIIQSMNKDYETISIDLKSNEESKHNYVLTEDWLSNCSETLANIKCEFGKIDCELKLAGVICVAGGWAGGNISSPTILQDVQHMMSVNAMSAVLAGALAAEYLQQDGLLLFSGAALPFQESTPEMMGYHLSKAATHSLAKNLSKSQQMQGKQVLTILPQIIDTPMNRQGMPDADFSQWVSMESLSNLVKQWVDGNQRPINGSFILINSEYGQAIPKIM